jgi:hypothetical protein
MIPTECVLIPHTDLEAWNQEIAQIEARSGDDVRRWWELTCRVEAARVLGGVETESGEK